MNFESGPHIPKTHNMSVFENFHSLIERGEKTCEVRVAYPRFKRIQIGDNLDFGHGISKKVVAIEKFSSIDACLATINPQSIFPGQDEATLRTIWHERIDPHEISRELGIIAFKFE